MNDRGHATWKAELVNSVVERIQEAPVIGIVNISGVPAPQLQRMRAKLRGHMRIQVIKNNLLEIALKKAAERRRGIDQMIPSIEGQMAVLFSDMNPFKLCRLLDQTKTRMPAKGGETAPADIEIKAGETPFKPGPIIGELQKAGIPAAIEQGKVVVKKDKLLVKKGEEITREVALALTKFDIFPLTVGLELRAAFDDGTVFNREVLAIDDSVYTKNIAECVRSALNLSVFAGIPNRLSVRPMLSKAHLDAITLSINLGYPTRETAALLVAKANAQCLALASRLTKEALDDELSCMVSPSAEKRVDSGKSGERETEEKKEDKKEKKVSEEEAAAGLGALFG